MKIFREKLCFYQLGDFCYDLLHITKTLKKFYKNFIKQILNFFASFRLV